MITKDAFIVIKKEVEEAINQAFQYAKDNEVNEGDFILFLANAEYIKEYKDTPVNPFIVDYRANKRHDKERMNFLLDFINKHYNFPINETSDTAYSITLELMIYSHIWESKPYLRQIKKLANLCQSIDYDWSVAIPSKKKQEYIRNNIRDIFLNSNLSLHSIITNGFHSSLRNAFAHSDYLIDINNSIINLKNYSGEHWELKRLSINEWTVRFSYSFLLCYLFSNKIEEEKLQLSKDYYSVKLKRKNGSNAEGLIQFDHIRNSFRGLITNI